MPRDVVSRSAARPRDLIIVSALAGISLVLVLAVALTIGDSVEWRGYGSDRVGENAACGDDGAGYCDVAEGKLTVRPYGHRFLIPTMARALPGDARAGLHVVTVVGIISTMLLTAWLATAIARRIGSDAERARWAGIAAGAMVAASPLGLRFGLFYPTLVDHATLALCLGWIICFLRGPAWALPVLAGGAVLAKEGSLAVVLAVGVLVVVADRSYAKRAILSAIVAAVGAAYAMNLPEIPDARIPPFVQYWAEALVRLATNPALTLTAIWGVLFIVGILPFLANRRILARDPYVYAALGLILASAAVASTAPEETARLLYPATAGVFALTFASLARYPARPVRLYGYAVITLVLARPWTALDGTRRSYVEAFTPFWGVSSDGGTLIVDRLMMDLLIVVVGLAVIMVVEAVSTRRTPAGSTRSGDVPADLPGGRSPT